MLSLGFMIPLNSYADEVVDLLSSGGLTETHQTEHGTNTSTAPFYQPDGKGSDTYSPAISLSNTSSTNSAISNAISSSSGSTTHSWHTIANISTTGSNTIPASTLYIKAVLGRKTSSSAVCTILENIENVILESKAIGTTKTLTCYAPASQQLRLIFKGNTVATNYDNYSTLRSLQVYY